MPITFDETGTPKLINITSPTTTITVQQLHDACRAWEHDPINLDEAKIIDSSGKKDMGGGVISGIIMSLSTLWRIKFWSGVGVGIIKDGTVVPTSGYNGTPIEPTGGNDTIVLNNQIGGVISVVGSGVTEQDKADIVDLMWDESKSGHSGSLKDMADDLDNPNQYKATGFSTHTAADVWTESGRELSTPNNYKADVSGLAPANEYDSELSALDLLIKQNREGNIKYEYVEAIAQNNNRNVAVGKLDRMIIKIKNDTDSDWSSPVSTKTLYMWYAALGDDDPIYVGESD